MGRRSFLRWKIPKCISRLHVHGFIVCAGEAATFTEKIEPAGDFKEKVFDDNLDEGQPTFFNPMRAFYDRDTYTALPGGLKAADEVATKILGSFAKWWHPRKWAAMGGPKAGRTEHGRDVEAKL